MAFGNRGILSQAGSIMQVNNALVEEVSVSNNTTGYIIISYVDFSAGGVETMSFMRLNVNRNTAIINLAGGSSSLSDIQEGMWIDALFSPMMTRSIPPQSNAFLILVRRGLPNSTSTTTDRILAVDFGNNTFVAGTPNNINRQTRFLVTDNTLIRNRQDNPISFSDLQPGQMVRIIHSNAQTASIPPQTTAYYVQLL